MCLRGEKSWPTERLYQPLLQGGYKDRGKVTILKECDGRKSYFLKGCELVTFIALAKSMSPWIFLLLNQSCFCLFCSPISMMFNQDGGMVISKKGNVGRTLMSPVSIQGTCKTITEQCTVKNFKGPQGSFLLSWKKENTPSLGLLQTQRSTPLSFVLGSQEKRDMPKQSYKNCGI